MSHTGVAESQSATVFQIARVNTDRYRSAVISVENLDGAIRGFNIFTTFDLAITQLATGINVPAFGTVLWFFSNQLSNYNTIGASTGQAPTQVDPPIAGSYGQWLWLGTTLSIECIQVTSFRIAFTGYPA